MSQVNEHIRKIFLTKFKIGHLIGLERFVVPVVILMNSQVINFKDACYFQKIDIEQLHSNDKRRAFYCAEMAKLYGDGLQISYRKRVG